MLANDSKYPGDDCWDKLASQEKPPIAEGRPVQVATGMLPAQDKVALAQPII